MPASTIRIAISCLVVLLALSCTEPNELTTNAKDVEPENLKAPILTKLGDNIWLHSSWKDIEPWGPVLSNGLVIKTTDGVYMIDTAWNDEDTEGLFSEIERRTGDIPRAIIATHAHDDKLGGANFAIKRGVPVYGHPLTIEDAPTRGLPTPNATLNADRQYFADGAIIVYYPGPAHTRDNIVVYHEPSKTLHGGCLIRPGGASGLGNTADADIGKWAESARNIAATFPTAEIVIPSHGAPGGPELIDHTFLLADAARE